jgi:hypothetical protein
MKITQDVRDYTAAHGLTGVSAVDAGLKEKAERVQGVGRRDLGGLKMGRPVRSRPPPATPPET